MTAAERRKHIQRVIPAFSKTSGMVGVELCDYLGISNRTLSRWFSGVSDPKVGKYTQAINRINMWYQTEAASNAELTLYSLGRLFKDPSALPPTEQYALILAAGGIATGYLVSTMGDRITTPTITGLYTRNPEVRLDFRGLDTTTSVRLTLSVEANTIKCESRAQAQGQTHLTIGELTDAFIMNLVSWVEAKVGPPNTSYNYLVKD